jgi:hypothetical protein
MDTPFSLLVCSTEGDTVTTWHLNAMFPCSATNKYLLLLPSSDCQSFWLEGAEYQEPSCAVCEDGQILLYQHKCSYCGLIHMCATHLVIYAQYICISRTVRITIYSTAFSIGSLNSNAASKIWACCDLNLTCMRQALCCTCWNCTFLRLLTVSRKLWNENCS